MQFKIKKTIGITQILILVIGILAFSYMLGEIGKKSGIEISRGVGIVSAQAIKGNNCDEVNAKACSIDDEQVLWCHQDDQIWKEFENCGEKNQICQEGKCVDDKEELVKCDVENKNSGKYYVCRNEKGEIVGEQKLEGDEVDENGKLNDKGKNKITSWLTTIGGGFTSSKIAELLANGQTKFLGKTIKLLEVSSKPATEAAATNSLWGQLFSGQGATSTSTGISTLNVVGSAVAAAATAAAIYFIFKAAGAGQQNLNMIANAGLVGAGIGFAASFAVVAGGATVATPLMVALGIAAGSGPVGWVAAIVTAFVMGVWILFGYQDYVQEIIKYEISAWQPQTGGAKCEECNNLEFGCTEYQCKTFGKGCGVVNKGTTQERCVWLNPNDREYPVITENITISKLPETYNYKKSTEISPPDTGVEITSSSKNCIPPFSSLTLGVKTDEPAQCRISASREKEFDKMVKDMDEGTVQVEKHTKILPNSATANNWALNNLVNNSALPEDTEFEITKGNEYEYYIKCKDANGNENPANFVIKFCVQDKDLTAPIINGFFIADKSFVQFNTPDVVTEVYTNEPAECKWDFQDKTYKDMQYGMTNCDTTINQATIQGNSCTGNFTGLKNGEENKYYIRCQDRSEDKNTNTASEVYTLKVSSKSVLIDSITVNKKGNNSIIKDARDVIPVDLEVKTSFGAENGKAKCKYNYLNNWIDMSFDYKEVNTQTLWLPEGEYTLPISCNDIAGDTDTKLISFKVVKDRDAPIVARAYYDVNNLKVITNEPAECVYTNQQNIACAYDFDDGTAMSEIGEFTHYTSWQANKKYHIKCKDAFGNQPLPGQCSIIVKAFESYK